MFLFNHLCSAPAISFRDGVLRTRTGWMKVALAAGLFWRTVEVDPEGRVFVFRHQSVSRVISEELIAFSRVAGVEVEFAQLSPAWFSIYSVESYITRLRLKDGDVRDLWAWTGNAHFPDLAGALFHQDINFLSRPKRDSSVFVNLVTALMDLPA